MGPSPALTVAPGVVVSAAGRREAGGACALQVEFRGYTVWRVGVCAKGEGSPVPSGRRFTSGRRRCSVGCTAGLGALRSAEALAGKGQGSERRYREEAPR